MPPLLLSHGQCNHTNAEVPEGKSGKFPITPYAKWLQRHNVPPSLHSSPYGAL
jgi:hypothetical protein